MSGRWHVAPTGDVPNSVERQAVPPAVFTVMDMIFSGWLLVYILKLTFFIFTARIREAKMASKFWVLSNEDSKAIFFRSNHVKKNGGVWTNNNRGWAWSASPIVEDAEPFMQVLDVKKKRKSRIFKKIMED